MCVVFRITIYIRKLVKEYGNAFKERECFITSEWYKGLKQNYDTLRIKQGNRRAG